MAYMQRLRDDEAEGGFRPALARSGSGEKDGVHGGGIGNTEWTYCCKAESRGGTENTV